jgi:sulfatase maturation enzyme AslB (radical SAM superfamily)
LRPRRPSRSGLGELPLKPVADHLPAASPFALAGSRPLDPAKFRDPFRTAAGQPRAAVDLGRLDTLWLNTGTLCNLACPSCYIESTPRNDALLYLRLAEAEPYLEEAVGLGARVIGFTGGEPFMNPDMLAIMASALGRGFDLLILTNAMRPMRRYEAALASLSRLYPDRIVMRVSLDDPSPAVHDAERGAGAWRAALDGLAWLRDAGFRIAVAGRRHGPEAQARAAYARLFEAERLDVDHLVLFPTLDAGADVAEVSEECWSLVGVDPGSMMCASSRMVVRSRDADRPHVVACTLLPYDPRFALGDTLADSSRSVPLNHPHCARFCVLGGASCSG